MANPIILFPLVLLSACVSVKNAAKDNFPPSLPHGQIKQIFPDIFMVTGANVIDHDGVRIQASRNMVIVRQNHDLTLINSVRLDQNGLKELENLGQIKNIIRIGAFHGRDDAFYQQRYNAKLWAFGTMEFSHGEKVDFDLKEGKLPLKDAELFTFKSTLQPEALILINKDGGILIACDSIKNWTKKDGFFDDETFAMMTKLGSIGEAKIDSTWLGAMKPSKEELAKILTLKFEHLLSAHGEPLKKRAKSAVSYSINNI